MVRGERGDAVPNGEVPFLRSKDLSVGEAGARLDEGFGSVLHTDAHHEETLLADTVCQARVVAVTGHDTEAVHESRVQEVHGVDDERSVSRVLGTGVGELLDGSDGVVVEPLLPDPHLRERPVGVYPSHGHLAVSACLGQHVGH